MYEYFLRKAISQNYYFIYQFKSIKSKKNWKKTKMKIRWKYYKMFVFLNVFLRNSISTKDLDRNYYSSPLRLWRHFGRPPSNYRYSEPTLFHGLEPMKKKHLIKGAVLKRRHGIGGRGYQGFCDKSTRALVLNAWRWGIGVWKIIKNCVMSFMDHIFQRTW